MWNWSNSTAGLFLQTGNMSEKAVGYTTVGGDLEGGLYRDLTVTFEMEVKKFATQFAPGSTECVPK